MGESVRCPYCGWTGATRTASVCEYLAAPAGGGIAAPPRGPLVRRTDQFECEHCRRAWDEETFRRRPASAGVLTN